MAAPERGWQTLFQHRNIPAGGYSKSYSKVSFHGNDGIGIRRHYWGLNQDELEY